VRRNNRQLNQLHDDRNFQQLEEEFRLMKCRRFLASNSVEKRLSRRILDWTQFQQSNETQWNDSKELIMMLPHNLQTELSLSLHEKVRLHSFSARFASC